MKYTDNVRFNNKLNLGFLLGVAFLFSALGLENKESIYRSICFTLIYSFASAFIQPDLDQESQRPGKDSFPIGQLKAKKVGKFLFPIFYPLNRIWYYFWHPYGFLLTHRGLSHWPIIGTWTRSGYILLFFWGTNKLIHITYFNQIIDYLKLFFPTAENRSNWISIQKFWITYVCPFFVADLIHFFVDLFDSVKNNTRFSSYAHSPGFLIQSFNPKMIKYHKRALKKAKSNSKKNK